LYLHPPSHPDSHMKIKKIWVNYLL
jgi:hypothetical protein